MTSAIKLAMRGQTKQFKPSPISGIKDIHSTNTPQGGLERKQTKRILRRKNLKGRNAHLQYLAILKAITNSERASSQPTDLIPSYGPAAHYILESEQDQTIQSLECLLVGTIFSQIMTIYRGNQSQHILVQVLLNEMTYQYQLKGIFLNKNMAPIRIRTEAGRRRLCKYLNQVNSQLIYGSYLANPETGHISFKISASKSRQQFNEIAELGDKFCKVFREDMSILKMCMAKNAPLIRKVYTEERQEDVLLKHLEWFAEVLPMMNQSTPFVELDANREPLKQQRILEGHIIQSQESFRQRCEELSSNRRRVTAAREGLNRYLSNSLIQLGMEEIVQLRGMFIKSPNIPKYYEGMFQKPKQYVANVEDNINVCAEIAPAKEKDKDKNKDKDKEKGKDALVKDALVKDPWQLFTRTANAELRRQKVKFMYGNITTLSKKSVTYIDGRPQLPPITTKLVALKSPITSIRKDGKSTSTYLNSSIKRQSEFVKIMESSECTNMAKYYYMEPGQCARPQKDKELDYNDCVLMDYYTYKSTDNFVITNCNTLSSLSLMNILVQTLTAMRFMKNSCITHCDLKTSNVLIGKGLQAKVADFGHAHIPLTEQTKKLTSIKPEHMERHLPGYTLPYSPPELFVEGRLNLAKQGHKFDVFSFGVMTMELLFGIFPIEQRKKEQVCHDKLIDALRSGTYMNLVLCNVERLYYHMPGEIAEILCMMALKCLDPDPQQRPCIDWLLVMMRGLYTSVEKIDKIYT